MAIKPNNMSRRGFLRLIGVTSMTLAVPGLLVPAPRQVEAPVGLLLPQRRPILVCFTSTKELGFAASPSGTLAKITEHASGAVEIELPEDVESDWVVRQNIGSSLSSKFGPPSRGWTRELVKI